MKFNEKTLFINSILFICMVLLPFLQSMANALETQILTIEEIEKGAMEKLASIMPWDRELLEINVDYEGKEIILPAGKIELIYQARGNNKRAGRIPLTLKIKVDNNIQKTIRINNRVLVLQEVVKTTRLVKKGEILTKENIKMENIKTELPLENAIQSVEYASGYETSRNLPKGKIITQNIIKKPALVNKGDKILILAEKGGMKITAPGILKEDGFADAMVRVLNIESKKIIYGRLLDVNTVKVTF
jgi:flagellar basal body P-ring formation protein FlgA